MDDILFYWRDGIWPLCRLLLGLSFSLLLANLLEATRWTDNLAKYAAPVARAAHLSPTSASAFALAFVSPAAANGLLSEKFHGSSLSFRELMLANLFNGLPAYLSHAPTLFLLTWPVLGNAAIIYVGVTLVAAFCRTGFTIILGRHLLPEPAFSPEEAIQDRRPFGKRARDAFAKAWRAFLRRMPKLACFSAPIYLLMWAAQKSGFFKTVEAWMSAHLGWLDFLNPQAMSIVLTQLLAETGATLGAAGAALADGSLSSHDVVTAMLVGNVLATPLRAIRHQLPAYAGFYSPKIALKLVVANQALRGASMILTIAIYVMWG